MNDLAFHITDIAENSIKAKATVISIALTKLPDHSLRLKIADNGTGMTSTTLSQVTDPFYTTRTTRHVGLGLAFLKQNCEQTGGHLTIESTLGEGTTVVAYFMMKHIDALPLGNIANTLSLLITGNPTINFKINLSDSKSIYEISTEEIKHVLQEIPISRPEITIYLENNFKSNISTLLND